MISFEKKYNKMGHIKILRVGDKKYTELWESEGNQMFKRFDEGVIEKIKKDDVLKNHIELISDIIHGEDYEIPDLIVKLENELREDKNNKQCDKCKHWAEGYKTIKAQCGLFNQKCKFELKEMREDKGK